MLRWRLLLGTVFIAGLVGLLVLDARAAHPGMWLLPLALLVTALATQETWELLEPAMRPRLPLVILLNLGIVASNYAGWMWPLAVGPAAWPLLALATSLLLIFAWEIFTYQQPGGITARIAGATLVLAYAGLLMSAVVQLRLLGPGGAWGIAALASLVLAVKLCDTGAYTVGRLIGRHKMAPRLSPGKTWEGALGGLAASTLGIVAFQAWLWPAMVEGTAPATMASLGRAALFGLVVGAAGMLGDLAESLLKRDRGVKDSSRWMPGFGGVLDLMDSILIGAPVAYLGWLAGWIGP